MANFVRALKWSLSIVGGGLGFWYLKDPTRRRDLLDFPPLPHERLRALLGCEVRDREKGLFGEKLGFSLVVKFCDKSEENPRSYMEREIDPDLPFVNPLEALNQLELLEDQFRGPFGDEPDDDDPDEIEDFEPNAPPEYELEDEPPGVEEEYLPRRLGPNEIGNVVGPAGGNPAAPAEQGAVGGVAEVAGEEGENAAARRVAEAVVRDVLESAHENLAANRAAGSDENRGAEDVAGSSGNEPQRPATLPSRRPNVDTSPVSTPKKQRAAMMEESEDEQSTSSG